jgi:nicotinamidase/pyrazinamidase
MSASQSASQSASKAASAAIQIAGTDVLLVIDPQQDFCSGGQLAVPDGDAVIPLINQIAARFQHVILTQDWHPASHISFASNHPNTGPYDQILLEYGQQTLWPEHCVQGTPGAEFHPGLHIPKTELILRKGFRPQIDSYSAFLENDKITPTGLAGYLRERGFKRIFLAGLAYDYCVRFSAIDGQRAGFTAIVLEDACRAVALPGSVEATCREFADAGVLQIKSPEICA